MTLPPGRLRLATKLSLTGSLAVVNTMGIVAVAALAEIVDQRLPPVTKTATWTVDQITAIAGNCSSRPAAQRYSIVTFWPSTKPSSLRPKRRASARCEKPSADCPFNIPTTGTAGCCACTESDSTAAKAPTKTMNSRRRIDSPQRHRTEASYRLNRAHWKGVAKRMGQPCDVRFGSKADICSAKWHVRFAPNSGHVQCNSACPLSANSGHRSAIR